MSKRAKSRLIISVLLVIGLMFCVCRKPIKDLDEDSLSPGVDLDDSEDDNSPLFHQPGKTGFYSPRPGKCTEERLNCFRNVGRYAIKKCCLNNPLLVMMVLAKTGLSK